MVLPPMVALLTITKVELLYMGHAPRSNVDFWFQLGVDRTSMTGLRKYGSVHNLFIILMKTAYI